MLASTNGRLPQGEGIPDAIAVCIEWPTFKELDEHMLDTTVNDNHVFKLIKTVSKSYDDCDEMYSCIIHEYKRRYFQAMWTISMLNQFT